MENSVITDQNAIFSKKWKSNKKVEKIAYSSAFVALRARWKAPLQEPRSDLKNHFGSWSCPYQDTQNMEKPDEKVNILVLSKSVQIPKIPDGLANIGPAKKRLWNPTFRAGKVPLWLLSAMVKRPKTSAFSVFPPKKVQDNMSSLLKGLGR